MPRHAPSRAPRSPCSLVKLEVASELSVPVPSPPLESARPSPSAAAVQAAVPDLESYESFMKCSLALASSQHPVA